MRVNLITGKSTKIRIISMSAFFLGFSLFSACAGEGPYVEVNGKKLTEKDLEKDMSGQYKRVRSEYESKIQELLTDLAVRRMFELEAKENDKSVDEYVKGLVSTAPVPSSDEIEKTYKSLKEGGRIKGSLNEMRGRIMQFLMQEKQRTVMSNEISRLKEKYNYNTHIARTEVAVGDDPTRGGNASAPITIVEFSDFECPFCRRAQSTTSVLREKYGDKIRWVFKDFPLDFHPQSMGAHIAAECVRKQDEGKFWKYFDRMFSGEQNILHPDSLRKEAQALNIDMNQFDKCLVDPAIKAEVENDIAEGQGVGVTGTPAFFVNGRMISGALPVEEFEKIISEEL